MEVTRRRIDCCVPHPTLPTEFDVLRMDDGFVSVVPSGSITKDVYYVDVSGNDTLIAGIRSFGDVVVPSAAQVPGWVGPERQSSRWTLSDCFHGLNLGMFLWGKGCTAEEVMAEADSGVAHSDQTKLELKDGDVLACVTADPEGRTHCFDEAGNEIHVSSIMNPRKLHGLRHYYAFCGVLSTDRSKFTVHCIWNTMCNIPVGPPYDRRIAKYVGLDFAPTAADWLSCEEPIMVRLDGRMPLVISKQ